MSKDLPESKPEPEKNCGNCGNHSTNNCPYARNVDLGTCQLKSWQPKPAEPQSWEQRFDKEFPHCGGVFKTSVKSFIRAEIEMAEKRGEEQERKRWTSSIHIDETCGYEKPKKQNKHK